MSAGSAAAIAAAAVRQRILEEEEQMTTYSESELQDDWEFKIVRANREVFSKPTEFQKLLKEEKQAGWILLEKLDNSRVRFKRQRNAKANDNQLISQGIDPYRTHYGMPQGNFVLLVLAISFVVIIGLAGFILLLTITAMNSTLGW